MHALLLLQIYLTKKYSNSILNVTMKSSSKIPILYINSTFLLKLKQITGFAKFKYDNSKYQSNK